MTSCKGFEALARERIAGLHGLRFVKSQERAWTCSVFFANETTGVQVEWEIGIHVLVGWLVDGRLPDPPERIGPSTKLGSHDLTSLMALHGDHAHVGDYQLSNDLEVGRQNMVAALDQVIDALERYAGDILDGDFSTFARLDEVVRARAIAGREGELGP